MNKNVGQIDKLIRLIVALVLFLLVYLGKVEDNTTQIILLSVAFIAALTSLINFCPLYKLLNFNTLKNKR
jgi:hypothetical protein